jgi:hypothetical protein
MQLKAKAGEDRGVEKPVQSGCLVRDQDDRAAPHLSEFKLKGGDRYGSASHTEHPSRNPSHIAANASASD